MVGTRKKQFVLLASRRLGLLVVTYFIASLLLFFAIRAIPGDPVALRLKNPDPERVALERDRLGLDQPWPAQFGRRIVNFWRGEWGASFGTGRLVAEDVRAFLPATLELTLAAILLGVSAGVFWALAGAWTGSRWISGITHAVGMAGLTVPIYWIGLILLVAGSLWTGWFPPGGRVPAGVNLTPVTGFLVVDAMIAGRFELVGEAIRYLFLPAVCLSVYPAAQVCATLRARLDDARLRALLVALRARGLPPVRVWMLHLLKLLTAPVVTVVGTTFGVLLGGAVLTETVFSWPGMGRYLVNAVLDRDIYVIENALLLVVLLVLAVVQLSDLAAAWLNPVVPREERDDDQ